MPERRDTPSGRVEVDGPKATGAVPATGGRWISRAFRILAPVGLAIATVWVTLHAFGNANATLGPFRLRFDAVIGRPLTEIRLPPLGRVVAPTHAAPLHLAVTLEDVAVQQLPRLLEGRTVADLVNETLNELPGALVKFGLKIAGLAVLSSLLSALIVFRRLRPALVAMATAAAFVSASELITWATYRPEALLSPTFSGSLRMAPGLVGPVRGAVQRIEALRAELSDIIQGTLRVYEGINPQASGADSEIKVLHISDIHLSPLGMDFARDLAAAFDVDVVLDTGDLTSFGTQVEQVILVAIPAFRRPYVFVRGNHDSRALQEQMSRLPNAIVLDGEMRVVAGLSIYGLGHPAFTPNKQASLDDEQVRMAAEQAAERIALDLAQLPRPPDVVAVHDDRMAEPLAGTMPLVVSGHFHLTSDRIVNGTLFLRIASTGGSGANVFRHEGGIPLAAEILHFSRSEPHELLAWDVIEQSAETGSVTVTRHVLASP